MMMIMMKVLLRTSWKMADVMMMIGRERKDNDDDNDKSLIAFCLEEMADVMMINVREREEIDNVNKLYFTSSYPKLARKILLVPILY